MKNRKEKRREFLLYCKRVWLYLELEMMIPDARSVVDEQDIGFYYKANNDFQTAAFLIKEMLPKQNL